MANKSCTTYALTGFGQECQGSASGVKRLLIGLAREWKVSEDKSTGATPHSATISAATSGDVAFYEYYINEEAASLTSTLNVNNANGVKYYSNVITATFVRMRPDKHIELQALANEKLVVIVQDNNGQYWIVENASASAETAQTGQAFDDLSGYQVEITSRTAVLPWALDEDELPTIDTPNVYD